VHAKNLSINQCSKRQIIEYVSDLSIWVCISILAHDFIVETLNRGNLSGFVITSQQRYASRLLELQAHEVLYNLNGVIASVYKVANKYVVGVRYIAAVSEEFE